MSEQISFETNNFVSNPEPRCPCVLLLDVSGSMSGKPVCYDRRYSGPADV